MRKPPKSAYEFSDDFEVTYEEDISSKYKVNPESDEDSRSGVRTETMTQPMPRVRDSRRYDLSIEDPDDGYDVSIGSLSVCPMPGGKEADRLPLPPPSKKVEGPCTGSPRLFSGTCR